MDSRDSLHNSCLIHPTVTAITVIFVYPTWIMAANRRVIVMLVHPTQILTGMLSLGCSSQQVLVSPSYRPYFRNRIVSSKKGK